ncbi:hypothetical protein QUB70_01655 [Microcoleus sp. A003_D6]|uniref:hypothetical protein n=1 Tax=Microcoleus sp. A003_D6 TaxID=3055266 RepID=UPI002FD766A5
MGDRAKIAPGDRTQLGESAGWPGVSPIRSGFAIALKDITDPNSVGLTSSVRSNLFICPLAKITRTGSPAHPTKFFFLWNGPESPFQNLIKRIFARGLFVLLKNFNVYSSGLSVAIQQSFRPTSVRFAVIKA